MGGSSTMGGLDGIRDRGLIEFAGYSANSSFEDIKQYKTIKENITIKAYMLDLL